MILLYIILFTHKKLIQLHVSHLIEKIKGEGNCVVIFLFFYYLKKKLCKSDTDFLVNKYYYYYSFITSLIGLFIRTRAF